MGGGMKTKYGAQHEEPRGRLSGEAEKLAHVPTSLDSLVSLTSLTSLISWSSDMVAGVY